MRNVLGLFLPDELKGEERLAELLCKKVLQHAIDHLADGGDFDRRIAMISVDNAVELMVKTFLGLRRRASGDAGPTRRELEACEAFPALLDILEKYAGDRTLPFPSAPG